MPFIPGSYVVKATKVIKGAKRVTKVELKVASSLKELQKGKYLTIGQYSSLRKVFKGKGKTVECHHIIEKRLGHIDLKKSQYPAVALSPELHREITTRWKRYIPYGTNYSELTKRDMIAAAKKVYKDMPELKKIAIKTIKQYYC